MNTKRVLLSGTVISLQDSRFVYPCCDFCLSRLTEESHSRSRCRKCGFTCDTQNVAYRFRLSLKVSRDTSLFGVTVFGGCLKPFFGITAGDLQRFLQSEKFEGPPSLQQLLIKAVEDCFIGKCLVFGFKLSGHDAESCLLGEHTAESVQFVSGQVIPPHGAFLGVTVFAYLQSLMQANTRLDCSPKASGQWQQKDSLPSSFDHTLPLCQKSCSVNSDDGLMLRPPWHSVSNLDLCFSPEETRGSSLPEVSGDINSDSQESLVLQYPNNVPFIFSQAKHSEHNRLSTSHKSLFNASFISPIKTTSCNHASEHLNQWASKDCLSQINASFAEKSLFNHNSFALEDPPLSETLGDFVCPAELQIVNWKVLSPTSERVQAKTENSILLENNTIPTDPLIVRSLNYSLPVLTPLHDVTNDEKSLERKNRKRKSFSVSKRATKLSCISKRLLSCDIKDVASNRTGSTIVQSHATREQENQSSGYEDAYNVSADLFHQSSTNTLDMPESSFSNADTRNQDSFVDDKVSEPNISCFNFAPSLQSTPIVNSSIQRLYRQSHKLSKKWSGLHWSKKSITGTSLVRVLQNNTGKRQLDKCKFNLTSDSVIESSEISAGGSELKVDVKHTPGDSALPTNINDCSRDLFDPSF